MKYRTVDEWNHFRYGDAQVVEMKQESGHLYLVMDGVTILTENSCNRDLTREMGANDLHMKFQSIQEFVVIEEGYKSYNADGVLQGVVEDRALDDEEYSAFFQNIAEGMVYSIEKKEEQYELVIDGEERTYTIHVKATHDVEEWDRFINKL